MNGEEIGWNKPQRVTIGLPSKIVPRIMDEWLYRDAPVAMTVRRAKTKGLNIADNGTWQGKRKRHDIRELVHPAGWRYCQSGHKTVITKWQGR